MQIQIVKDKNDLRRFIELPYRLYRNDPIWVSPLRKEQFQRFDSRFNPMLNQCDYKLFPLLENGQVIGRISAFVDQLAVKFWKEPVGLFGSCECVDSDEGSPLPGL